MLKDYLILSYFSRRMSLDTASTLRSIPAQPEAFSVTLTDFLGEVRTIPIEFCLNAEVCHVFLPLTIRSLTYFIRLLIVSPVSSSTIAQARRS